MAILHKSVLGTFTNKVGGVVGSSWKGIPVVRSLPASVANPRSAAQMTQRMRFALMINFSVSILVGWIRPLWNRDAKRMSGFNAFVRANMSAFNNDGNIVLSQLIASHGRLLPPASISAAVTGPNTLVTITHPSNDRYATSNDEIYLIAWQPGTQHLYFSGGTGVVRGTTGSSTISLPYSFGASLSYFAAYRHPRGIFVSRSLFYSANPGEAIVTPTAEFLFEFAKIMKIDTSNIDTSLDEASAIAVLKDAIKEKAAMKKVTIKSEGDLEIIHTPDKHPYEPELMDIDVDKEVRQIDYEPGELDMMAPQSKKGMHRGNR